MLSAVYISSFIGAKSTTEGNPSQPSLGLNTRGTFRFRWTVPSGTRTIQIDVKQAANASPRPRVTIKANTLPPGAYQATITVRDLAQTGDQATGQLSALVFRQGQGFLQQFMGFLSHI